MTAASKKKIFGVVGFPVRHSLSPLMHNAVFKCLGVNAAYKPFEVKPEDLKNFVLALKRNHIFGLNVTIPHKESIIPFLPVVRDTPGLAHLIGAVNTVRFEDGKPVGYNTDGLGFVRALKSLGFDFKDKKVALFGAGGAAKAVAFNMAEEKASSIHIYDLNSVRCEELVKRLKTKFPRQIRLADSVEALNISKCDILINATPVGMHDDRLLVPVEYLHKELFVYDLVYNPKGRKTTRLIAEAKKKGLKAHDGIWMLVFQGAIASKIWFPEFDEKEIASIMFEALRKEGFFAQ
ncbi:MAG: shikimate dehydrogenase [Candidatus Omnitrophota bacterium]|nr:shikimate dehydrogenase [Candidatus Omnitrophota bacterium]